MLRVIISVDEIFLLMSADCLNMNDIRIYSKKLHWQTLVVKCSVSQLERNLHLWRLMMVQYVRTYCS